MRGSGTHFQIFSAPTNRLALEYEMENALFEKEGDLVLTESECDFLSTCLVAGTSFNEDGFFQRPVQLTPSLNP